MALGLTQPLTEMSTRYISLGGGLSCRPVRELYHLLVPTVKNFWKPQPPGDLRASLGT
jgi:hypothetical protein